MDVELTFLSVDFCIQLRLTIIYTISYLCIFTWHFIHRIYTYFIFISIISFCMLYFMCHWYVCTCEREMDDDCICRHYFLSQILTETRKRQEKKEKKHRKMNLFHEIEFEYHHFHSEEFLLCIGYDCSLDKWKEKTENKYEKATTTYSTLKHDYNLAWMCVYSIYLMQCEHFGEFYLLIYLFIIRKDILVMQTTSQITSNNWPLE